MKETISYCGKHDAGDDEGAFFHFYPHPGLVKMCGYDEIFKVRVTEIEVVPNVHAIINDHPKGDYYAWWDEEDGEFQFTAPNLHCVEICFPYGSKAEVERGRGNVYKVRVEVIEE